MPALRRILAAHAGRAGTRGIRTLLAERTMGAEVLRSVFEARFLSFLAGRRLPRPKVNAVLSLGDRRVEVDCLWPDERVIVELDGHGVHGTRAAFERDRERDRGLQVAGWRVVRVTWRQFHQHPDRVERDLRALLAL